MVVRREEEERGGWVATDECRIRGRPRGVGREALVAGKGGAKGSREVGGGVRGDRTTTGVRAIERVANGQGERGMEVNKCWGGGGGNHG